MTFVFSHAHNIKFITSNTEAVHHFGTSLVFECKIDQNDNMETVLFEVPELFENWLIATEQISLISTPITLVEMGYIPVLNLGISMSYPIYPYFVNQLEKAVQNGKIRSGVPGVKLGTNNEIGDATIYQAFERADGLRYGLNLYKNHYSLSTPYSFGWLFLRYESIKKAEDKNVGPCLDISFCNNLELKKAWNCANFTELKKAFYAIGFKSTNLTKSGNPANSASQLAITL